MAPGARRSRRFNHRTTKPSTKITGTVIGEAG
jgi:hypothetical protein